MDNMTALHYLVRKGVTKSPQLTTISKRIWGFLEFKWDYTYCFLDPVKEKHDSRVEITSNSSECNLNPKVFHKIVLVLKPTRDGTFCLKNYEKTTNVLNPDPECVATNALYQKGRAPNSISQILS